MSLPRLTERVVSPAVADRAARVAPRSDARPRLPPASGRAPGAGIVPQPARRRRDAVSSTPLDRSRPLWEFTLIEGLADGRAALLQRVHHTVTDGVGGLKLSLSLVDFERDPVPDVHDTVQALADEEHARPAARRDRGPPRPRLTPRRAARRGRSSRCTGTWSSRGTGVAAGAGIALHPTAMPRRAQDAIGMAASLRRQVLVAGRAKSPAARDPVARSALRRRDDRPRRHAVRAAHALGGSINDVFVTGVAGALGLYHDRLGIPVDELRMAMAVSTRASGDDHAGQPVRPDAGHRPDHAQGARRPLQPGQGQDHQRAPRAGARGRRLLRRARGRAAHLGHRRAAAQPDASRWTSRPRTCAAARSTCTSAAPRIEASYPMGPRSGCAVNVTALSYCGDLCLGIHSDPAAVTDPEAFVECLRGVVRRAAGHRRLMRSRSPVRLGATGGRAGG